MKAILNSLEHSKYYFKRFKLGKHEHALVINSTCPNVNPN
jgi:hypothetical protein